VWPGGCVRRLERKIVNKNPVRWEPQAFAVVLGVMGKICTPK